MKYNCLIVDDEEALAQSTCEYFNMFGVTSFCVYKKEQCLEFLKSNSADLILLDINLGGSSGFELCKTLRKDYAIPILFISARTSDDDILIALNIGGDDYIKKPYSLSVLLAKVKIYLKRFKPKEESDPVFKSNDLTVDFSSGRVSISGSEISLNPMEYKLLCYLIKNIGRIIPKEELFENIWQDKFTSDGTLNVHIRHLREKIEKDPQTPIHIKTVWGRGYLFEK